MRLVEVPQNLVCPTDKTHLQFIENRMRTDVIVDSSGKPINEGTVIEYTCCVCGAVARKSQLLFG